MTSPHLLHAAARSRTESQARAALARLDELQAAAKAARIAYFECHSPNGAESIEAARLLRACVAAELSYDDAMDQYGKTGVVTV